ncbi:hypothetical protein [Cupriavidus sp. M-11]|uniref:hypothetical protein n=1 Tax=Cupriavidus sp. M-11 TaxID=3233038 RepID=UPI003F933525
MTFSLPERIDPRHCIVTKQYAVYTPPMHEMIKQVGDWIEQQRPGSYVYGASRLGKTRCVQWYVAKVLEERFKAAVPLVVWNRRPDSQTSEAGLWHQIFASYKLHGASSDTSSLVARSKKAQDLLRQRHGSCRCQWAQIGRNNGESCWIMVRADKAMRCNFALTFSRCPANGSTKYSRCPPPYGHSRGSLGSLLCRIDPVRNTRTPVRI